MRMGFAFFALNACSSLLIWMISQFRPEINIALLYQIEKFVFYLLVSSIPLSILTGVVMKYLNRQVFKLDNFEDFLAKDSDQDFGWLGCFLCIYIIFEIVQGLFGHLATQVEFSHGSWVLMIPRSGPMQVAEAIAYDRMWGQCRATSINNWHFCIHNRSLMKLNRSSPLH